jgi:hypothetical protein
MKKSITETARPSSATYEVLEEMVRLKAEEYIQEIIEDEVEHFWEGRNLKESSQSELKEG